MRGASGARHDDALRECDQLTSNRARVIAAQVRDSGGNLLALDVTNILTHRLDIRRGAYRSRRDGICAYAVVSFLLRNSVHESHDAALRGGIRSDIPNLCAGKRSLGREIDNAPPACAKKRKYSTAEISERTVSRADLEAAIESEEAHVHGPGRGHDHHDHGARRRCRAGPRSCSVSGTRAARGKASSDVYECTEPIAVFPAHAIRKVRDGGSVGEIAGEGKGAGARFRKRSGAIARLIRAAVDQQQCRAALREGSSDGFADLTFATRTSEQDRRAQF